MKYLILIGIMIMLVGCIETPQRECPASVCNCGTGGGGTDYSHYIYEKDIPLTNMNFTYGGCISIEVPNKVINVKSNLEEGCKYQFVQTVHNTDMIYKYFYIPSYYNDTAHFIIQAGNQPVEGRTAYVWIYKAGKYNVSGIEYIGVEKEQEASMKKLFEPTILEFILNSSVKGK